MSNATQPDDGKFYSVFHTAEPGHYHLTDASRYYQAEKDQLTADAPHDNTDVAAWSEWEERLAFVKEEDETNEYDNCTLLEAAYASYQVCLAVLAAAHRAPHVKRFLLANRDLRQAFHEAVQVMLHVEPDAVYCLAHDYHSACGDPCPACEEEVGIRDGFMQ